MTTTMTQSYQYNGCILSTFYWYKRPVATLKGEDFMVYERAGTNRLGALHRLRAAP